MTDPSGPDALLHSDSRGDDDTLAGTRAGSMVRAGVGLGIAPGVQIGRYIALRELGRGANGHVWAAVDPELDRKVAIKVLALAGETDQDRRALLREAQAMARLDDPNVVAVHDVGLHAEHVFIAMDFVDGQPLDAWSAQVPRSADDVLAVLCQAGRGLAAAHAAGIVHRDFKPPNVLVGRDGRVRVADFGIAHGAGTVDDGDADDATLGSPKSVLGTPAYMSPEQHDPTAIDHRSDQFSFCVALFEALAGRRPFTGSTIGALAAAKIEGRVNRAAAECIPRRLRAVILRGLAADPDARHASMTALLDAIEAARRKRWPWLLAAGSGIALAGVVAMWAARSPSPVDPCADGGERVAAVWSVERAQDLRVIPDGTTESFARERAHMLRATLDDFARDFQTSYPDACAASRAAGASERERRLAVCVDQRLETFRGLVDAAASEGIDALSVDPALATVQLASTCTGDATEDWIATPSDPFEAQRVLELRGRIDRVRWRRLGGREVDLAIVEALAREAAASGDAYTHATAQLELASSLSRVGNTGPADAAREEAVRAALRAGLDRLAARALNQLLLNMRPQQFEEARRLELLAATLVERTGTPDEVHGHLALNLGNLYRHIEKYDLAAAQYDLAEARYVEALGATSLEAVDARVARATLKATMGRHEGVLETLDEALEAYRAQGQYDSPRAVAFRERRAVLMMRMGHLRQARAPLMDALSAAEEIFGAGSRNTADARGVLAVVDATQGRFHEARIHLWLAHAVAAPPGDRDDMWAEAWGRMAQVETLAGNFAWATELTRRCGAAIERAYGDEPTIYRIVPPMLTADIERRGGNFERALHLMERAREDFPADRESAASTYMELQAIGTLIAAALGRHDEAAAWAAALPEAPPQAPEVHAVVALARALVAPANDAKARAEVEAARAVVARELWPGAYQLRELDAWLAGRWPLVEHETPE